MQILDILGVGVDHVYRWPSGNEELYPHWIEYRAAALIESIAFASDSACARPTDESASA